mmetsp:Transcript_48703/g.114918  ORF Transcript_48703/g.114918 Transcript_48703/m.114918 type:complete len:231 (-) Transcript_48703:40-732(-)
MPQRVRRRTGGAVHVAAPLLGAGGHRANPHRGPPCRPQRLVVAHLQHLGPDWAVRLGTLRRRLVIFARRAHSRPPRVVEERILGCFRCLFFHVVVGESLGPPGRRIQTLEEVGVRLGVRQPLLRVGAHQLTRTHCQLGHRQLVAVGAVGPQRAVSGLRQRIVEVLCRSDGQRVGVILLSGVVEPLRNGGRGGRARTPSFRRDGRAADHQRLLQVHRGRRLFHGRQGLGEG